jgi:hypothetical protein
LTALRARARREDRGEIRPVLLDIAAEIVVRPDPPDATEFAGHRHDLREQLRHAGRSQQLRQRLQRLFVNKGRQPQRLDVLEVTAGGRLDAPVHVADMVEQRDRELRKAARFHRRGDDRIGAWLRE